MSEQDNKVNQGYAAIGKFFGFMILFVGLMFLLSIINGFVMMKLWKWFMVPVFNLPVLTIVQAIGIGIIIAFLTHPSIKKNKGDQEDTLHNFVVAIVSPFITLLFGWVVTWFM